MEIRMIIIIIWLLQLCRAVVDVSISFLDFNNERPNALANGDCCDTYMPGIPPSLCPLRCDPVITVCLTATDSQCSIFMKRTSAFENSDHFSLNTNMGGLPNPLKVKIQNWRKKLILRFQISDTSFKDNTLMDTMEHSYNDTDLQPHGKGSFVRQLVQGKHSSIAIFTALECSKDYYGESCDVKCIPPSTGHFMCNSEGRPTCIEGWTGTYCNTEVDACTNNTCQNNATCVISPDQVTYTCDCNPPYIGHMCAYLPTTTTTTTTITTTTTTLTAIASTQISTNIHEFSTSGTSNIATTLAHIITSDGTKGGELTQRPVDTTTKQPKEPNDSSSVQCNKTLELRVQISSPDMSNGTTDEIVAYLRNQLNNKENNITISKRSVSGKTTTIIARVRSLIGPLPDRKSLLQQLNDYIKQLTGAKGTVKDVTCRQLTQDSVKVLVTRRSVSAMSTGTIVGITVGLLLLLVLAIIAVFILANTKWGSKIFPMLYRQKRPMSQSSSLNVVNTKGMTPAFDPEVNAMCVFNNTEGTVISSPPIASTLDR